MTLSRSMWVLSHNHTSVFTRLRLWVVVLPSRSRLFAPPPSTIPIPEVRGVEGNGITLSLAVDPRGTPVLFRLVTPTGYPLIFR